VLIGLIGRRRSGKDTFAQYFIETLGYRRKALADIPKAQTSRKYGLPANMLWWEDNKDKPYYGDQTRTYRELLIEYANGKRALDPDVWVKTLLAEIEPLLARGESVIVTDVRFPNEAELLHAAGAVLFKIERPQIPIFCDLADSGVDEIDGALISRTFVNNAGVNDLWRDARDVADTLG
jgi:hypothetical protein